MQAARTMMSSLQALRVHCRLGRGARLQPRHPALPSYESFNETLQQLRQIAHLPELRHVARALHFVLTAMRQATHTTSAMERHRALLRCQRLLHHSPLLTFLGFADDSRPRPAVSARGVPVQVWLKQAAWECEAALQPLNRGQAAAGAASLRCAFRSIAQAHSALAAPLSRPQKRAAGTIYL